MKLYFYRPPKKETITINFGDELNPWLWDQLLPGIFDEDEETTFIGIGTLLNNLVAQRVSKAKKIVVFSTGVGYGQRTPTINDSWKIYCVRGPLSAKALGLSEDFAVTDGAALLRRVVKLTGEKRYPFAYMPHISQSEHSAESWQEICNQLGFKYIDARWPIEEVLTAIGQTEVLLAEAMHGAIVADALRVPWVPIHTAEKILSFKWQDWCASVGVEYKPYILKGLNPVYPLQGLKGSRSALMTSIQHFVRKRQLPQQLNTIAKTARPNLSQDAHIEALTDELETRLEQFKQDVKSGYFKQ